MKKIEVISICEDIKEELMTRYKNIPDDKFILNPELNYKNGFTVFNNYMELIYISIGTKGLDSNCECSDYEMMIPIVGMFHEVEGHYYQMKEVFQKDTILAKSLAVNHFACLCSEYYYYKNYYHQPYEIAAQYSGIKGAYDYLICRNYSRERAEYLICNYVNNRIKTKSEFIKFKNRKKYTSIKDVLEEFKEEYARQMYAHRKFVDKKMGKIVELGDGRKKKEFDCYSKNRDKYLSAHQKKMLKTVKNGAIQDLLLAYLYCIVEDKNNYLSDRIPGINSERLSAGINDFEEFLEGMKRKNESIDLEDVINPYINERIRNVI